VRSRAHTARPYVKLWQFAPEDRSPVRIDTCKMPFLPDRDRADVEVMPLFQDADEYVRLERWAPDAAISLPIPGGAELLVIEGSMEESGDRFEPQSWLRLPAGAGLRAEAGSAACKVWMKTGHLACVRGVTAPA
jgi:ChrR Cupin-like domain